MEKAILVPEGARALTPLRTSGADLLNFSADFGSGSHQHARCLYENVQRFVGSIRAFPGKFPLRLESGAGGRSEEVEGASDGLERVADGFASTRTFRGAGCITDAVRARVFHLAAGL